MKRNSMSKEGLLTITLPLAPHYHIHSSRLSLKRTEAKKGKADYVTHSARVPCITPFRMEELIRLWANIRCKRLTSSFFFLQVPKDMTDSIIWRIIIKKATGWVTLMEVHLNIWSSILTSLTWTMNVRWQTRTSMGMETCTLMMKRISIPNKTKIMSNWLSTLTLCRFLEHQHSHSHSQEGNVSGSPDVQKQPVVEDRVTMSKGYLREEDQEREEDLRESHVYQRSSNQTTEKSSVGEF